MCVKHARTIAFAKQKLVLPDTIAQRCLANESKSHAMDINEIKKLVHNQYILNYIMQKLGFWKMQAYAVKNCYNCYSIKLFRSDKHYHLRSSPILAKNGKHTFKKVCSTDYRLKLVAGKDIHFLGLTFDFDIIVAKNVFLDILKSCKAFKWHGDEYSLDIESPTCLETLVIEAELNEVDRALQDEEDVVNYLSGHIAYQF